MMTTINMYIHLVHSVADIAADQWHLLTGKSYPFLRHEFLLALEKSGSIGEDSGWLPCYPLIYNEKDELIAALPLYLKFHSYGEFVFDWAWADAYQRHGIDYYPKLIAAIPFTPATGTRLIHRSDYNIEQLIPVIKQALTQLMAKTQASSWHCLFPQAEELTLWQQLGGKTRLGCQFHWYNQNFEHFDDFLATMTAKKRKNIRQERAAIKSLGLEIQRYQGQQISEDLWQHFYQFYCLTNQKYNGHDGYLNAAFFSQIYQTLRDCLLLVLAFEDGKVIAAALNFIGDDCLYGRYWGCQEELTGLHFELCYYQGIEFCIEQGLSRFDAGAQGEHKIARGFKPILTYSSHFIVHQGFRQAIEQFIEREAQGIQHYQQEASLSLPFKIEIS